MLTLYTAVSLAYSLQGEYTATFSRQKLAYLAIYTVNVKHFMYTTHSTGTTNYMTETTCN